jgi:predicted Zn-dependent protease
MCGDRPPAIWHVAAGLRPNDQEIRPMSRTILLAAAALAVSISGALAMGSGPSNDPPPAAQGGYNEAENAVKAKQYEKAITQLRAVLAAEPRNVNALNYMAYSHRELGRYNEALGFYRQALAIDANHRGANEYLGQLYLKMGRVAEARAQLAKLERICGRGCEEYESLRAALPRS